MINLISCLQSTNNLQIWLAYSNQSLMTITKMFISQAQLVVELFPIPISSFVILFLSQFLFKFLINFVAKLINFQLFVSNREFLITLLKDQQVNKLAFPYLLKIKFIQKTSIIPFSLIDIVLLVLQFKNSFNS